MGGTNVLSPGGFLSERNCENGLLPFRFVVRKSESSSIGAI